MTPVGPPRGRATSHRPTTGNLLVWITVAFVLLSVSCTSGDSLDPAASDRSTPAEIPDSAGMEALLTGRLVADSATGCVGIAAGDDTSPALLVQWPDGIQPRTDPVRLLDDKGDVVAREGDLLELAGGSPAVDAPAHPCGRPPDFIVNRIESVS